MLVGHHSSKTTQIYTHLSTMRLWKITRALDFSNYYSLKRPGHHTAAHWQALINSLWMLGEPTAANLHVFDDFWNQAYQILDGFPNLHVQLNLSSGLCLISSFIENCVSV
jgi:hypothetical protein